jgi:hypothetical protein
MVVENVNVNLQMNIVLVYVMRNKKMRDIETVYNQYKKTSNMSFNEFLNWSKTDCSKKASVNREPIKRNLVLLGTPKEAWTEWHANQAKKMLSFEARHKNQPSGKIVKGCGVSKRTIARKNWAVDPNK